MTTAHPPGPGYHIAPNRAVVSIDGPDARPFLQGIVSNDVARLGADRAIWAAFLTPQGKYLFDFFMAQPPDHGPAQAPAATGALLLDCEAERRDDLIRRLSRYRLRSKVSVAADDDRVVALIFGEGAAAAVGLADSPGAARAFAGGVAYVDPRHAAAGVRTILPRDGADAALAAAGLAPDAKGDGYDRLRLSLGLPDGSRDLEVEKTILIEAGFHELHGIDWKKGCYMGQELTARTFYRGLVKKRLVPVAIAGATPEPGTPITSSDGQDAGEMRSSAGDRGLALIRLAALEGGHPLTADGATITPTVPDWMRLQPGPRAGETKS